MLSLAAFSCLAAHSNSIMGAQDHSGGGRNPFWLQLTLMPTCGYSRYFKLFPRAKREVTSSGMQPG